MPNLEQSLERERLAKIPYVTNDAHSDRQGVLLSNDIKAYIDEFNLINPFCSANLKPAGYELSVGNEYVLGGDHHYLDSAGEDQEIAIPPFQVAFIKTKETLNLPSFLIGRWNLRVHWAYKGLLWVGAAQVDPGYVGHLFCPLYNLGHQVVYVRREERIALIDFVKTTKFKPGESQQYVRPPTRPTLSSFGLKDQKSALFTEIRGLVDEFEKKIQKLENQVRLFGSLSFTTLAILVAAGAAITGFKDVPANSLNAVAIVLAAFALVAWLLEFLRNHRTRMSDRLESKIDEIRSESFFRIDRTENAQATAIEALKSRLDEISGAVDKASLQKSSPPHDEE